MDKEGPDAIIAGANALAEEPIAQTGNVAAISVADVAVDSSNIIETKNDLQRVAAISVADVALSIAAVGLHGTMDFISPAGTGETLRSDLTLWLQRHRRTVRALNPHPP